MVVVGKYIMMAGVWSGRRGNCGEHDGRGKEWWEGWLW